MASLNYIASTDRYYRVYIYEKIRVVLTIGTAFEGTVVYNIVSVSMHTKLYIKQGLFGTRLPSKQYFSRVLPNNSRENKARDRIAKGWAEDWGRKVPLPLGGLWAHYFVTPFVHPTMNLQINYYLSEWVRCAI